MKNVTFLLQISLRGSIAISIRGSEVILNRLNTVYKIVVVGIAILNTNVTVWGLYATAETVPQRIAVEVVVVVAKRWS